MHIGSFNPSREEPAAQEQQQAERQFLDAGVGMGAGSDAPPLLSSLRGARVSGRRGQLSILTGRATLARRDRGASRLIEPSARFDSQGNGPAS